MRKYTKTYLKAIGEETQDNNIFISCECCNKKANEIHHILNKNRLIHHNILNLKDNIENIMAICRVCHNEYGDINAYIPLLLKIHSKTMISKGVKIDKEYINRLCRYYEVIS